MERRLCGGSRAPGCCPDGGENPVAPEVTGTYLAILCFPVKIHGPSSLWKAHGQVGPLAQRAGPRFFCRRILQTQTQTHAHVSLSPLSPPRPSSSSTVTGLCPQRPSPKLPRLWPPILPKPLSRSPHPSLIRTSWEPLCLPPDQGLGVTVSFLTFEARRRQTQLDFS